MKSGDSDDASSSDNSVVDETDDSKAGKVRGKRDVVGGIAWCGVDTESNFAPPPRISWPPSPSNANWRHLRPVRVGNPFFKNKMQLYSKTNYNLAVYPDGSVRGTKDDNDVHTYLELISAGHTGHVRIRGILTNLYIAMDDRGRLYGEVDMTDLATVFIESFQGSYKTYMSVKYSHLGWYLGIKKSGRFKKGSKTGYGQKAIMFLSRRYKFQ